MNRHIHYISYVVLFLLFGKSIYYSPNDSILRIRKDKLTALSTEKIIRTNTIDTSIAVGKRIFNGKCMACHTIFKDRTGPALAGVNERWPDKKELFAFMRNPAEVIARNSYAKKLKEKFRSVQPAFFLTDKEMQSVLDYIKNEEKKK